jgi:thiamine monophosphate kinase
MVAFARVNEGEGSAELRLARCHEILATVPAGKLEAVRSEAAAKGVAVTEIGTIRAREDPVRVLDQHGKSACIRPCFL